MEQFGLGLAVISDVIILYIANIYIRLCKMVGFRRLVLTEVTDCCTSVDANAAVLLGERRRQRGHYYIECQ